MFPPVSKAAFLRELQATLKGHVAPPDDHDHAVQNRIDQTEAMLVAIQKRQEHTELLARQEHAEEMARQEAHWRSSTPSCSGSRSGRRRTAMSDERAVQLAAVRLQTGVLHGMLHGDWECPRRGKEVGRGVAGGGGESLNHCCGRAGVAVSSGGVSFTPRGELTLPEGLVEIGKATFAYCDELTSVALPAGLVEIGEGAFEYCDELTSGRRRCRYIKMVQDGYAAVTEFLDRMTKGVSWEEQIKDPQQSVHRKSLPPTCATPQQITTTLL
ncbi:hypothetical protein AB1Y20_014238 [Prymnesium parvum]|uniref:Leucine-rich repeat protein n=1 Tax=Prymnesium parvum TaxID=97485 RepID=A0AB34IFK2_PRYPA